MATARGEQEGKVIFAVPVDKRLGAMKPWHKVLLVLGGYVAAFAIASIIVSVYVAATNTPDRATSSGMYAFGDAMFFLGCFGLAAIPATMAALYFLRPYPAFWRSASIGALALATTGVAALGLFLRARGAGSPSSIGFLAMLSPLRILVAPGLGLAFLLSALFAPARAPRIALLCACIIEAVVFVWVALLWSHAVR